jgi:hypothetical protein
MLQFQMDKINNSYSGEWILTYRVIIERKIKKNPIKCKVVTEEELVLGLNIPHEHHLDIVHRISGFQVSSLLCFLKGTSSHESEHFMSCKEYTHNKSFFL